MKIYKADGTMEQVDLQGRKVTLEQLQQAVGGYIEAVPGTNARAYCNEEGMLTGLPFNAIASHLFGMALVGNVVVLETGDKQ
jgi:hypothetical protein